MHFLNQIKTQFFFSVALHNTGPSENGARIEDEAAVVEAWTDAPDDGGQAELERMLAQSGQLWDRMRERGESAAEVTENLETASWEVNVTDYLIYSEDEGAVAREALWGGEEITDEQVREHIMEARVAAINSNSITDGEREVLESAFIDEIAAEAWVDADTMRTLRALGFDGAQSWPAEDTAENLRAMAQSLSEIQAQIEERGLEVPEDEDEFLAMYDYLMQTDDVDGPLSEEDTAALWIQTEVWPDGNVRIDPNTPGYTEMPNGTVMWPPGAPYSTNGNIYAGRPSEIAPGSEDVTYDSLTAFQWGAEMTDTEVARLQWSAEQKERNKELIEARFPSQWYNIAIEFCNTEGNVNPEQPIALACCPGLIAIVSYPGEPPRIEETPISIGRNGYGPNVVADHDPGSGGTWDRRTQTWRVQHFGSVSIAWAGNVVRGGWSMTGAIIESPEWLDRGGRWWHGGRDGRFPGQNSYGCVVATDEFMIRLANAVNTHGWGYGFQSAQWLGEERPSAGNSETPAE